MSERQGSTMDAHSEDGAVAVMVAVFIASAAILLLAFATDIGSLWQSQRALVTDTDAAALAGAIELAEDWMENDGECGDRAAARAEAVSVLGLNNPDGEATNTNVAADADCEPVAGGDFAGWVEMSASQPSPGFFSGRDDLSANGTTTAEFILDISDFAEGLAICADLFPSAGTVAPEFTLENGNLAIPYALNAVLAYEEQLGSSCGLAEQGGDTGNPNTPGGWGWIATECDVDVSGPGTYCPVLTGTNLINGFESNIGGPVRFPIFDDWNGENGAKAGLRIVGYMDAVVEAQCTVPKANSATAADPAACNLSSNLVDEFAGQQSHFIVVSNPEALLLPYNDPIELFDIADYSICDVQGDRRFCRSSG